MTFQNLKINSKFKFLNSDKIYRKEDNLFAYRLMRLYYIYPDDEVIQVENKGEEYIGRE